MTKSSLASSNHSCWEIGLKKSKKRKTDEYTFILLGTSDSSSISEPVIVYNSIKFSHSRVEIDKCD